jgi:hypothetical protein
VQCRLAGGKKQPSSRGLDGATLDVRGNHVEWGNTPADVSLSLRLALCVLISLFSSAEEPRASTVSYVS